MVVRAATAADEAAVFALTWRLAAFPLPGHRTAHDVARSDDAILREAFASPSPATCLVVADDGGAVVGYVFATTRTDYFTGAPYGYIENLAVAEGATGRGIARALMEAAESWAAGRGYDQVALNVFAGNERARAVYARLGYEPELIRLRKPIARG